MRFLAFALILGTVLASFDAPAIHAGPNDDADTRGLFIKSRPRKTQSVTPKRPVSSAPQPAPPIAASSTPLAPPAPVGFGFSLYRVVDQAHAVRVNPSAIFRKGDSLRFVVEPSIDGYLYVFVSTGEKSPVMIYPDSRLERGDNFVYAHTTTEVPSRRNPELSVFAIAGDPATERVFFIVSRAPLPGVPIGDALVASCKQTPCPWSPGAAVWDDLGRQATAERRVSVREDAGATLSAIEDEALTRDLVLGAAAAQPTVVALSGSADTQMLVHLVSIRHQ